MGAIFWRDGDGGDVKRFVGCRYKCDEMRGLACLLNCFGESLLDVVKDEIQCLGWVLSRIERLLVRIHSVKVEYRNDTVEQPTFE